MKIGIVGGTGEIGEGMAMRLSVHHNVAIGSRDEAKASISSECTVSSLQKRGLCARCCGVCNQEAVDFGDVVILAIPYRHVVPTLSSLAGFEEKTVVSPVNPLAKAAHFYFDPPAEGSAALLIKSLLPKSARVVTAFNNIAANRWQAFDEELDYSVAVCGDDDAAKETVMALVNGVSKLRAYDAGPLAVSSIVESITPLLLNVARYNKMKDVGIRFV
ncbi:MAG: NADPH-dependent F420 reductase [Methanomicrobiaceae archaeon]|nr:NADPH-dependent F420 reductase [Methanomicrobiaceae archaeon]